MLIEFLATLAIASTNHLVKGGDHSFKTGIRGTFMRRTKSAESVMIGPKTLLLGLPISNITLFWSGIIKIGFIYGFLNWARDGIM